ncbi:ATP-binding Cassette (ABC) superfamily [Phytophthora infestans T30-4]|uniref:ATP-binding Cassette (ABC) superfamily n=1 Tax=Phytophthora infestans (strain T30-4) TaxID=403677 RepID=D0NHM9_PHYIT|nr:ATP-binding Cassette (ABC) superfamily [Phytophthora infestans T30-4]EEY58954.1 ATP-binding Cassette (ABC) superfamily [Phytophthora infestans T30-4]|eukprot:XP_002901427.1 ATP-binding Cassette (ABC) superfamily [Phytophthora infestans T30-4]
MGFSPPAYAIPSGYEWLYTICPHQFALSNLVSLVFGQCSGMPTWDEATQAYTNVGSELGCQPMANSPVTVGHITVKEYAEQYFGMDYSDHWRNFGIVIAWIIFFRLLGLVSLRYNNHQKR